MVYAVVLKRHNLGSGLLDITPTQAFYSVDLRSTHRVVRVAIEAMQLLNCHHYILPDGVRHNSTAGFVIINSQADIPKVLRLIIISLMVIMNSVLSKRLSQRLLTKWADYSKVGYLDDFVNDVRRSGLPKLLWSCPARRTGPYPADRQLRSSQVV